MADQVRLLNPPPSRPKNGGGAPRGVSKYADEQRNALGKYLVNHLMIEPENADAEIQSLDPAERTWLEIEMTGHSRQLHTFEYEP